MPDAQELAATYQKKTAKQHILDAPDTYIGSVEEDHVGGWIADGDRVVYRQHSSIPGLYKCFDEAIVNCRDQVTRLDQKIADGGTSVKAVTVIDVSVDETSGVITLLNDGDGIDVAKHPEHKIWIPEMIFAHLRTSTNYDKEKKKIVGGKNGFGIKLVFIYALWAKIETVDHIRGLKYVQEFKDNLDVIGKPSVRKCTKSKPYTKVSWLPDYKRFGLKGLTKDLVALFKKRTLDIAAITRKTVKVKFNKQLLPIRTFEQYINLYIGKKGETKRVYEKSGQRWEYAVCNSPHDEFVQVSFVNGICTAKGGRHVDHVLGQIVRGVGTLIEKKKKIKVKPATIKEQLMVFVNCIIENPSFDSQGKAFLNTPITKFGSRAGVSSKFIENVGKLGVIDAAVSLTEIKENKSAKKTDGRKTRTVRGLPKLTDANWAGGARSSQCTLILCEGDSAKSGIVSGLSKEDRNTYGVFPLRGKPLNAKEASQKKLNENAEFTSIKKILGLQSNKSYETVQDVKTGLRYGKVLFMTDQDLDGGHIKGLCINLFHAQWPGLLKLESFLGFLNTPILKARKGSRVVCFYNEGEYRSWRAAREGEKGWSVKYYKGLGTSTAKEFKEYFVQKKLVAFKHDGGECDAALDMVFSKSRSGDRKKWLSSYDRDAILDTRQEAISYEEFVNRELIHFSKHDCERSIPNLVDGLKPSTRKILYAAFKRKLSKEIKVAQLAGYVSEHAAYHHGEASLKGAIINMAQEFTGSNNINALLPNGQFGTRLRGGKDAASDRYIFTQLNPIASILYPAADIPVLNHLEDDGQSVEPEFYAPIIPMVLVNGGKGIGTGYSYEGLCYSPSQIVQYLRWKLAEGAAGGAPAIEPYYEGFKGTITAMAGGRHLIRGCYKVEGNNTVRITELPIGVWTTDYKAYLEKMLDNKKKPILERYRDLSTSSEVDITLTLKNGVLHKLMTTTLDYGCSKLEKLFKLYTTKTTNNMHLFDSEQQLHKYDTVESIIDAYYPVRYKLFEKRRANQLKQLANQMTVARNKANYIHEICQGSLDLRRKRRGEIVAILEARGYDRVAESYNYLLKMPGDSVLEENEQKLRRELEELRQAIRVLKAKRVEDIWGEELDAFAVAYKQYRVDRADRLRGSKRRVVVKRKAAKIK